MPLLRKILKADPREVIVKWTGSGTDTLTMAQLTSTGQSVQGTLNPIANIISVSVSTAGACTITRNSEVAFQTNDNFEFQTDGMITAVVDENAGSAIAVSLAALGTLIIRVKKMQGYSGI